MGVCVGGWVGGCVCVWVGGWVGVCVCGCGGSPWAALSTYGHVYV